ncbi:hypothetical protein BCV72DRAFT_229433 [Rhizopus microsporus var. microsporus]|uniref:Uncharacterized protein n=1 Tax=Rhizopus microsporus var. microsporus TaxID=86635 RepID=A0A1X0R0T8_RHIZD|nr:hypothetical protein BCV72DRAFT_229433 [Rhizopus microsporus var. microsporus]
MYSEQDYIVKFWSYVFEEAFSNSGLYLHLDDTQPLKAKKKEKVTLKIDLRILYSLNSKQSNLRVGEFAKKATVCKLYHDKLKQVLITKYHLKHLLSGLPTSTTLVPFVQIMGFECQLYVLRFIECFNALEAVGVTAFLNTHRDLRVMALKACTIAWKRQRVYA